MFHLTSGNLLSPTLYCSDTISSHDKKRYYLECLEQYITYLHEQLRLVGHEPVALERVSTYRGLTSRSIRVFLVTVEVATRLIMLYSDDASEHTERTQEDARRDNCGRKKRTIDITESVVY